MYVCLCRAISNTTIEAAIRAGATTVEMVSEQCGAATECGRCRHMIEVMLAGLTPPAGPTALRVQRRRMR
jgi:bacterioferritin-associated ferredoxin